MTYEVTIQRFVMDAAMEPESVQLPADWTPLSVMAAGEWLLVVCYRPTGGGP